MQFRKKHAALISALSCLAILAACKTSVPAQTIVEVTDSSFRCLHQMTKVRGMYVDNLLGNLQDTLAVANSADGGTYPPGTVVQLFPGEAMVKREKGASPASNDWEFFLLDVSQQGAKIKERGFGPERPANMFGSCFSCHSQAAPKWDMICEDDHGCAPIVFPGGINTPVLTSALQKTDKRCSPPEPLTPEELAELKKLQDILAAQAAAAGGQP